MIIFPLHETCITDVKYVTYEFSLDKRFQTHMASTSTEKHNYNMYLLTTCIDISCDCTMSDCTMRWNYVIVC